METLVIVSQHRNQCYSRCKAQGRGRFCLSPSRNFREINCWTFESGSGLLPTPLKACSTSLTKRPPSSSETPSQSAYVKRTQFDDNKTSNTSRFKRIATYSSLPIDIKTSNSKRAFIDDFDYTELWAGPAYSNSPAPSSLPIPKFQVKPKRTVSLEMPNSLASAFKMHPMSKSAPTSPTRESDPTTRNFFSSADCATKNLCRILNLDIADE